MSLILRALATGDLRGQFYADVELFRDEPDATRQVAAGYFCLAATIAWTISLAIVLTFNFVHLEGHVLAALNAIGSAYGFIQIRRRHDPRQTVGWLVLLFLFTICAVSLRHAGVMAPILTGLPTLAAVVVLFLRGRMRVAAIVLTIAAIAFCTLTINGVIGTPSTYTPQNRELVALVCMSFSTLSLGGLAWISMLSRDYAAEKLRRATADIVQSSDRSRVALEAARVGLWDVPNADKRQFHLSESFQSITGYTAEEFNRCFEHIEEFIHADDIVTLREAFALGRKRMSRIRTDFRLNTKGRGFRWFSARARYIQNDDGSVRISGSLQDINFIKAAEEALRSGRDRAREANKAKSDFIAMMSHEVRTPLNAILGSVEVMKRGQHDQETTELVALIDDAGRGLLAIVNDLLDVSKIEAGKLDIVLAPTDLTQLVTRTVDFWRTQASEKGLSLTVDCSQAEAAPILVDSGRVRQIIGNLVSNAIKFTDTGSISTRVSMHEARDGRVEILISVIDTGPGVSDAIAESIFAPFEQAPSKADRGGTGLGLFISRRLARLMGGELTLEPARRNGSHFRLSLIADLPPSESDIATDPGEEPIWAGRRVLCVDDNENNRRIADLLLSKFGITVTPCASGADALDLCAIETFDVILMDIVMPDMDGIETLNHLRGDHSCPNRRTPVIAVTAKLSADDMSAYVAAGFDAIAGKPVNLRELIQAVAPFMVTQAEAAHEAATSAADVDAG